MSANYVLQRGGKGKRFWSWEGVQQEQGKNASPEWRVLCLSALGGGRKAVTRTNKAGFLPNSCFSTSQHTCSRGWGVCDLPEVLGRSLHGSPGSAPRVLRQGERRGGHWQPAVLCQLLLWEPGNGEQGLVSRYSLGFGIIMGFNRISLPRLLWRSRPTRPGLGMLWTSRSELPKGAVSALPRWTRVSTCSRQASSWQPAR